MILGITEPMRDESQFQQYAGWVQRSSPGVEIVRLSAALDNATELARCDGLLLTGGGDVHPRLYGRSDAVSEARELNEMRDAFELGVIADALRERLPVLGICRGMQICNVALGGTLIPDVEKAGFRSHRRGNAEERLHGVHVEGNTLLLATVGKEQGDVNTSHHQAVERPGKGLRVAARSEDGVIEALEWEDSGKRPFLLLLQWHPERLKAVESPFALRILQKFVQETQLRAKQVHIQTNNTRTIYSKDPQ